MSKVQLEVDPSYAGGLNWNGGTIRPFNKNKNLHSKNEQDIHVCFAKLIRKTTTALI